MDDNKTYIYNWDTKDQQQYTYRTAMLTVAYGATYCFRGRTAIAARINVAVTCNLTEVMLGKTVQRQRICLEIQILCQTLTCAYTCRVYNSPSHSSCLLLPSTCVAPGFHPHSNNWILDRKSRGHHFDPNIQH